MSIKEAIVKEMKMFQELYRDGDTILKLEIHRTV
jgi:hypothetical protein